MDTIADMWLSLSFTPVIARAVFYKEFVETGSDKLLGAPI
jgi:hypothetical protein